MQGTPLTVCHDCKEMVLQVGKLLPGVAGGGALALPLGAVEPPSPSPPQLKKDAQ